MTNEEKQTMVNDLVRMDIIKRLRKVGTEKLYSNSCGKQQKFFYSIPTKNAIEIYTNWDYCLFDATLTELKEFIGNE
jgi:hypothetical protein